MLFEVSDWSVTHPEHADRQVIRDVSFHVRAGEVVGIAGLMGAGRTELAMSLFGRSYGRNITGSVRIHGEEADVSTVRRAIKAGLAYVTEDRKELGLILDETIQRNITLANLPEVSQGGVLNRNEETRGGRALPAGDEHPHAERLPEGRRTCRAATSRRWCCPNGSSPSPRC